MNVPLPHGWTSATVASLALRIQYGSSAKTNSTTDGIPVIRMGNIQDGKIILDDVKTLPRGHREFPDLLLEAGDVLFNRTNSPELVGKTAVFSDGKPTSFASYLIRVRLGESCHPKWLSWYINSRSGRDWIASVVNQQVGQANVSGGKLRELEVPLPPILEQRRIVAKLEGLLAKVDTSRERLDRIPTILKRFRQSVLAAACEGKLTQNWRDEHSLPGNWPQQQLSTLGQVTGGLTKSAKREGMARKAPYLRVANVYENRLSLGEIAVIGITDGELERTRLIEGDLLFVEGNGSLNQIGRVAMWDGTIEDCSHQNHLIKFRAGASVLPTYVLYQMMGPSCRTQLEEKATSSAGLHTLSISKISDVNLPIPTLSEQAEIVRRVTELFTFADQIEARYIKAKAQVDRLTQSILAKAFRGELVPQDPNDEPATALLERLKKTPSATPVAKRRGHPSKAKG